MRFKSLILAVSLIAANTLMSAQIIIDNGDMPGADSTYTLVNAINTSGYDFTSTGADYTWDFSELAEIGETNQAFMPVSGAPFTYQFLFNNPFDQAHLADFAINTEGFAIGGVSLDEFYEFYQNDEDNYTIVGYGATVNGIPIPSQTNPVDHVYDFPMSFGNTHASYSEWEITVPTFAYYLLEQDRSYEVDGWGTVITPAGSYEALRVNMQIDAHDSLFIELVGQGVTFDRNSTEYRWLAKEQGVPVLRVVESFGQTTSIQYKSIFEEPINVAEYIQEEISLYPSIGSGLVTQSRLIPHALINVYDLNGRLVAAPANAPLLDLQSIESGQYIVVIRSSEGVQRQSIVITH